MTTKILTYIKDNLDYLLIAVAALLGFYLKWTFQDVMMFVITVLFILGKLKISWLLKASAVSMLMFVLLLTIKRREVAEDFANYSFYFLVFATISIAANYLKNKNEKRA